MKPKTHKKKTSREIRVEKSASAAIAIGQITKGQDVFILTMGQFSLIDALIAILSQTGAADVVISTWTAAHAHLDKTAEMMTDARVRSLRMIVDRSFRTRQPEYFRRMIDHFGADAVRETRTHAKFMTIRNDDYDIVVRTSMNLNENPRVENIEISEDRDFADFFGQITDEIFREIAPLEKTTTPPRLDGIPDAAQFRQVQAGQINITSLQEPSYVATISR